MNDMVSAIASYGIDPRDEGAEEFYRSALGWFSAYGKVPDRVGVAGPRFGSQAIRFKAAHSRLTRHGFAGVKAIELKCMLDNWRNIGDFWMLASFSRTTAHAVLAIDSSLSTLKALAACPFIESTLKTLSPSYGFGYEVDHSDGPEFLPVGIRTGVLGIVKEETPEEYEASLQMARWGDCAMEERLYEHGIIRDVYPVSFLNESHLSAAVGATSFRRWIENRPIRGRLSPAQAGLHRWDVPEEQIEPIRHQLREAGIIYDWQRHSAG